MNHGLKRLMPTVTLVVLLFGAVGFMMDRACAAPKKDSGIVTSTDGGVVNHCAPGEIFQCKPRTVDESDLVCRCVK